MPTIFLSFNISLSGIKSLNPLPASTLLIGITLYFKAFTSGFSFTFEQAVKQRIEIKHVDISFSFFFIFIIPH